MWRRVNETLRKEYQTLVSIKTHEFRSVRSMGIEVGDIIYARLYTTSPKLTEFTHLLPRFVNCKVLKVISDTVLLVENLATGKKFPGLFGPICLKVMSV